MIPLYSDSLVVRNSQTWEQALRTEPKDLHDYWGGMCAVLEVV